MAATLSLMATACMAPSDPAGRAAWQEANDPLEVPNRMIFGFNDATDILVIRPATEVYVAALPETLRDVVHNFVTNLTSPVVIGNALLQGDVDAAGDALGRFMTNTILGAGGLADVSKTAGVPYKPQDFGKTMGVWGVGEGMYLVLPLLGPSTVRDAIGLGVDSAADPFGYWAAAQDMRYLSGARMGADGLDRRSMVLDTLDNLRSNSLDYYATIRSLYRQHRQAQISGKSDQGPGADEFPDYALPPPGKP
jgi:phospholipid-binding lipoprotein MlaA